MHEPTRTLLSALESRNHARCPRTRKSRRLHWHTTHSNVRCRAPPSPHHHHHHHRHYHQQQHHLAAASVALPTYLHSVPAYLLTHLPTMPTSTQKNVHHPSVRPFVRSLIHPSTHSVRSLCARVCVCISQSARPASQLAYTAALFAAGGALVPLAPSLVARHL
jgi:hypothetical protein